MAMTDADVIGAYRGASDDDVISEYERKRREEEEAARLAEQASPPASSAVSVDAPDTPDLYHQGVRVPTTIFPDRERTGLRPAEAAEAQDRVDAAAREAVARRSFTPPGPAQTDVDLPPGTASAADIERWVGPQAKRRTVGAGLPIAPAPAAPPRDPLEISDILDRLSGRGPKPVDYSGVVPDVPRARGPFAEAKRALQTLGTDDAAQSNPGLEERLASEHLGPTVGRTALQMVREHPIETALFATPLAPFVEAKLALQAGGTAGAYAAKKTLGGRPLVHNPDGSYSAPEPIEKFGVNLDPSGLETGIGAAFGGWMGRSLAKVGRGAAAEIVAQEAERVAQSGRVASAKSAAEPYQQAKATYTEDRPAANTMLPSGQYDLPGPTPNPSYVQKLLKSGPTAWQDASVGAAPPALPAGQYEMGPTPWESDLAFTKDQARTAGDARALTRGGPRALLPPTPEEVAGTTRAADVDAGIARDNATAATPDEVDAYRRMRDQGTILPGRDIGSPRPNQGESLTDFETRVNARQDLLAQGQGDLERRAIQSEPVTAQVRSGGKWRRNLSAVSDADLAAEQRRLLERNAQDESSVAFQDEARWANYQDLPNAEKTGAQRVTDQERAAGVRGKTRTVEDLPTGDDLFDGEDLQQKRQAMSEYNGSQVERAARQKAADRIQAELDARAGKPDDTSFDFGANREGKTNLPTLSTISGAGVGAIAGGTQGNTPEERMRNAAIGAVAGAGLGYGAGRGAETVGRMVRDAQLSKLGFPKSAPLTADALQEGVARRTAAAARDDAFLRDRVVPPEAPLKSRAQLEAESAKGNAWWEKPLPERPTPATVENRPSWQVRPAGANRTGAVGDLNEVGGAKSPLGENRTAKTGEIVAWHGSKSPNIEGEFKTPSYFSNDKTFARQFGNESMHRVALDIKKPYEIDGTKEGRHFQWDAADVKRMKREGYDGVVVRHPDGDVYTPFNPKQVRRLESAGKTADEGIHVTKTPAFKRWFGKSHVVDMDGEPAIVYHGTTNDFDTFDPKRGNPESDWGSASYFTNDRGDVAHNYAGEGPDLTSKIERRAEQFQSDLETDAIHAGGFAPKYGSPEYIQMRDKALEQARAEFKQHEGATVPVYLSLKKPVILGGPKETFLDYKYSPRTGNESGKLLDFIENLRNVASKYDEADVEGVVGDILGRAMDDGGIGASDLEKTLKDNEHFGYARDENGNLVSNEIKREAFERTGFDGVIDNNVNKKFGWEKKIGKPMAGMDENTVHYIAFKPEQVKSAIGNSGKFSRTNPKITGVADNAVTQTVGGAAVGGAAGAMVGDTPEERRRNAMLGIVAGGAGGALIGRGARALEDGIELRNRTGAAGDLERVGGSRSPLGDNRTPVAPEEKPVVERVRPAIEHAALETEKPTDWDATSRAIERAKASGSEWSDVPDAEARKMVEQESRVAPVEGFGSRLYSRAAKTINDAPFEKGTGQQWRAALEKGVPKDEREALALFLDANKDKVLTRAEVAGEFNKNRIQLGENTLGAEHPNVEKLAEAHREMQHLDSEQTFFGWKQVPADARSVTDGWKVEELKASPYTGQRDVNVYDPEGNLVSQRSGTRLSDADILHETISGRKAYAKLDGTKNPSPKYTLQDVYDHLETRAGGVPAREDVENAFGRTLTKDESSWLSRKAKTQKEISSLEEEMAASPITGPVRYASYVEPGGTNYREHVITLNQKADRNLAEHRALQENITSAAEDFKTLLSEHGIVGNEANDVALSVRNATETPQILSLYEKDNRVRRSAQDLRKAILARADAPRLSVEPYTSSHWPGIDNPLVHVRTTDRVLPNGEKALFLEEAQSDWNQQGRKTGYSSPALNSEVDAAKNHVSDTKTDLENETHWAADRLGLPPDHIGVGMDASVQKAYHTHLDALKAYEDLSDKKIRSVPNNPFKKTEAWTELGVKKAIDEAVKGGYDRVAWTTGDQQAARYDLSKQIDRLEYNPETQQLKGTKNGHVVLDGNYDQRALPDVIGKDAADKLLAQPKASDDPQMQAFVKQHKDLQADADRLLGKALDHPIDSEQDKASYQALTEERRRADRRLQESQKRIDELGATSSSHVLKGEELKLPHKGMRDYYDKIIPNTVKDYGKKLGVKIDVEPVGMKSQAELTGKDIREHAKNLLERGDIAFGEQRLMNRAAHWVDNPEPGEPGWRDALNHFQAIDEFSKETIDEVRGKLESLEQSRVRDSGAYDDVNSAFADAREDLGGGGIVANDLVDIADSIHESSPSAGRVAQDVADWMREHGDNWRIALSETEQSHSPVAVAMVREELENLEQAQPGAGPDHARLTSVLEGIQDRVLDGQSFDEALRAVDANDARALRNALDVTHLRAEVEKSIPSRGAGQKNLSFKITPELKAKVKSGGQPLGFADIRPLKTVAGAGVGAVAGGLKGDTPEERKRNALIGGLAGAGIASGLVGKAMDALGNTKLGDAMNRLIDPASRSEGAALAANVMRKHTGNMALTYERAATALEEARHAFDRMPEADNLAFINKMEKGQAQATPQLTRAATEIRKTLDTARDEIIALGTGKLEHFIEDYFPHIWKDPDEATDVIAKMMGKRPLEGTKSFLKQRTIPTTAEGIEAGLEPVSTNPVDLSMLKLREMQRYLMGQRVVAGLKDEGLIESISPNVDAKGRRLNKIPKGFVALNDRAVPNTYAPEPVARVFNNYLSPGLRGNALYDAVRGAGNTMNMAQLGLSAYHLGFTSMEAAVSRNALGIEQIADGRPVAGIKTMASSPLAPVTNYLKGRAVIKAGLKPGTVDGDLAAAVQNVADAGGRFKQDSFYKNGSLDKFLQSIRKGNYGTAGVHALPAFFEATARPIMDHIVPAQKIGVFTDLAQDALSRLPENATELERNAVKQKAWDSVDNRMGQMVYDNKFWNKALKDLSMASVRSVGWNVGTIAEVGGGLRDLASGKMTHRAAYVMALPMTVGLIGATTNYLYTGEGPKELKDYFFPRTGTYDVDGNPNRVSLPSYIKDVVGYGTHLWDTIKHKVNPAVSVFVDMLENKDFYGDQIYNEDDPRVTKVKQSAAYLVKQFQPFAVRNIIEGGNRDDKPSARAATFVGITPANKEMVRSPAQNLMTRLAPRGGARTPEAAEAQSQRSDILRGVREGKDVTDEISTAVQSGNLTTKQMNKIFRRAGTLPMIERFKALPLEDALRVYDAGDDREKALWKSVLEAKVMRAAK